MTKSKMLVCLVLLSCVVVLPALPVWQIKGNVKRQNGEPIQNASITVKGTERVVLSDKFGKYSLTCSGDKVSLVVAVSGFETQTKLVSRSSEGFISLDFIMVDLPYYEIVVTAEKREDNILEVPSSISVLPISRVESSGIKTVSDIHHSIPNFSSFDFGSGFSYNSVRGCSNTISCSSALGVYVDDVPVMSTQSYNSTDLIDIERVEVLRGPQGTLYGNNTPGGVINIITRQPESFWRNKFSAGIGSYGSKNIGLSVNGPIVREKLFLSVNFKHDRLDKGYYGSKSDDVKYGKYDNTYFRGTIDYRVSDVFGVKFSATNNVNHGLTHMWVPKDNDFFDIPSKLKGSNDVKQNTQSLRMNYSAKLFDLISITSRGNTDYEGTQYFDFTNKGLLSQPTVDDISFFTQEFRFVSKKDKSSRMNWIAGFFYNKRENDNRMGKKIDMSILYPYMPVGAMVVEDKYSGDIDSDTIASFGQVGVSLGGGFSFALGLRYEHNKSTIDSTYVNSMSPVSFSLNGSREWDSWAPKLSVDYRLNESWMFYGSVARGYKEGGFLGYGVSTLEAATFEPEITMNYELGFKSSFLDKRLMANAAFFYSKVNDMQVIVYNPQTMASEPSNVGKASIVGLEFEFLARVVEHLEFSASLGLLNAELKSNPRVSSSGALIDYKGNKAPLSPDYNLNVYLQYRPFSGFYARAEGVWAGKVYFDEENTQKQDPYFIGNLRVGYETGLFEFYLFGDNIFDKAYVNYAMKFGMIKEGVLVMPGSPRVIGLGCVFKW